MLSLIYNILQYQALSGSNHFVCPNNNPSTSPVNHHHQAPNPLHNPPSLNTSIWSPADATTTSMASSPASANCALPLTTTQMLEAAAGLTSANSSAWSQAVAVAAATTSSSSSPPVSCYHQNYGSAAAAAAAAAAGYYSTMDYVGSSMQQQLTAVSFIYIF